MKGLAWESGKDVTWIQVWMSVLSWNVQISGERTRHCCLAEVCNSFLFPRHLTEGSVRLEGTKTKHRVQDMMYKYFIIVSSS